MSPAALAIGSLATMPLVAEGGKLRALKTLLRRELVFGPQEVEARRKVW